MAIKPSTLKGTRDFSAIEIARRNFIKSILQNTFEHFGFEPIETPSFERIETLSGVYGEEGDRLLFKILNSGQKIKKADIDSLNKGFLQKFARSLTEKALRYDLTVPFARYVAQHQNELTFPFRRYQIQPVWRADRPQHGRFQEFYQCDADIVGERSLWQEIEVLSLYDYVFFNLKIEGVRLKVNHRKIISGIAGLLGAEERLVDFTIALDKLDKVGKEGIFIELKEKGFSESSLEILNELINISGNSSDQLKKLKNLLARQSDGIEGINELEFVLKQLDSNLLKTIVIDFDLTLARGLHYYTGMIVEVSAPKDVKIGSIGGGGRYDNLTETFGLKNMSGIGVSFGFERIYLVMEALDLFPKALLKKTKVLFVNFGKGSVELAYSCVSQLRNKNIPSELYPSEAKLKKQLGYANQKEINNVVMIGPDEVAAKNFVLKDMESGTQTTYPLTDLINIFS